MAATLLRYDAHDGHDKILGLADSFTSKNSPNQVLDVLSLQVGFA